MIEAIQFKLSALWIALMLTYLLGDVLRIFAGDFEAGQIEGQSMSQWMWVLMATLMLLPIFMVYLSLTLGNPANRWINIVLAVGLFLFNLVGLPTYPGLYDKYLIAVGLGINLLTLWHAWRWM